MTEKEARPALLARWPARRHLLMSFSPRTWAKAQTTFILPEVDIRADIDAINAGRATYDRSRQQFTINGRVWQQEANGTLFPVVGDGFAGPFGRGVIAAMRAYWRYNGVNDLAEYEISKQAIPAEDRELARLLWQVRSDARNDTGDRD